MLITNFSAGELSQDLFGRTDLPQYYNAAAKMENFDVIPTGGIKRRGGTERLMPLPGDGRIIPFVVDRNNSFLLYMTPGKITVYKLKNGKITSDPRVFTSSYVNTAEISEAHYVQKFDTMILCHENYQPLEIKIKGDQISCGVFNISIAVETLAKSEGINTQPESDTKYITEKWLQKDGEWPRAVTFFGGRLVFAGTKNNRQRVFVSAAADDKNFSTYKKFVEALPPDIVVIDSARITIGSNKITLLSPGEMGKFLKPLTGYSVRGSRYFNDETKITGSSGNALLMSAATISMNPNAAIMDSFNSWFNSIDTLNDWSDGPYGPFGNPKTYFIVPTLNPRAGLQGSRKGGLSFSVGRFRYREYTLNGGGWDASDTWCKFDIPEAEAKEVVTSKDALGEWVLGKVVSPVYSVQGENVVFESSIKKLKSSADGNQVWFNDTAFDQFIDDFWDYIQTKMYFRYNVNGIDFDLYGTPDQIKAQINKGLKGITVDGPVFFSSDNGTISDRYPTPDCGFTFELASDMNDSVRWMAVNKGLVIGTETAEWVVPPGVHATNQQAVLNTRYGSDGIQGTVVGDATVFFQAGKKSLVEYYIPQADNNFRVNNMAMLSPRMLDESPARGFDFISSPHTKLFVTREDGTMAVLLCERGTGTFAWGRITVGPEKFEDLRTPEDLAKLEELHCKYDRPGEGYRMPDGPAPVRRTAVSRIRSACAVPGPDGNDDVYLLVERGSGWYLERLREAGTVYLDGYSPVNQSNWTAEKEAYAAGGLEPKVCRIYADQYGDARYETRAADAEPDWAKGGEWYIGYSYTSVLRTMPALAADKMKKQRIVSLVFRFLDSHLPKMTSIVRGRKKQTDILTAEQPYNGIYKQAFPGTWDEEVQAELTSDAAAPVKILALNADMAGV
jgi:hypothetical protein